MLKKLLVACLCVMLVSAFAFAAEKANATEPAAKAESKDAVAPAADKAGDAKAPDKKAYLNNAKIVSLEADKLVVLVGKGKKAKEETLVVNADTKYKVGKKFVTGDDVAKEFAKDKVVNVEIAKDGDKTIAKVVRINAGKKAPKKAKEAEEPKAEK